MLLLSPTTSNRSLEFRLKQTETQRGVGLAAHASKQDADANIFDNDGNMVGTIFKGKKEKKYQSEMNYLNKNTEKRLITAKVHPKNMSAYTR